VNWQVAIGQVHRRHGRYPGSGGNVSCYEEVTSGPHTAPVTITVDGIVDLDRATRKVILVVLVYLFVYGLLVLENVFMR
jgi:hypothetical protein